MAEQPKRKYIYIEKSSVYHLTAFKSNGVETSLCTLLDFSDEFILSDEIPNRLVQPGKRSLCAHCRMRQLHKEVPAQPELFNQKENDSKPQEAVDEILNDIISEVEDTPATQIRPEVNDSEDADEILEQLNNASKPITFGDLKRKIREHERQITLLNQELKKLDIRIYPGDRLKIGDEECIVGCVDTGNSFIVFILKSNGHIFGRYVNSNLPQNGIRISTILEHHETFKVEKLPRSEKI